MFAVADNNPLNAEILEDTTRNLKTQISDLRKILYNFFKYKDGNSIPEDPFPCENDGYKTIIKLTYNPDIKVHLASLLEKNSPNISHNETRKRNPQRTERNKGLKLKRDLEENEYLL